VAQSTWRQIGPVLELVERFALARWQQPFSVLDVGCGWGHYGVLVGDQWPWATITGLDARPERCRWPQGYDRIVEGVMPHGAHERLSGLGYDLVLFLDVIEHLPKDQGIQALAWCRQRGPTILATPNGFMEQGGGEYDDHLSGWTPEELHAFGATSLTVVPTHVRPDGGSGQIVCLFDQE
jgi:2-polyprenyl-3-methyl-5-hydroxy-6-metoxy-1,4-benzoquinol methylase